MTKRKASVLPQGVCPTPDKIPYSTKRMAKKAARWAPDHADVRAYKCQCGRYHITSNKPRPRPKAEIERERFGE